MTQESFSSISQGTVGPVRGLLRAKMLAPAKQRNTKNVYFPQVRRLLGVLFLFCLSSTFYVGTSSEAPHAVLASAPAEAPEKTEETETRTGGVELEIHQHADELSDYERDEKQQSKEEATERTSLEFLGPKETRTIAQKKEAGNAGQGNEGEATAPLNSQVAALSPNSSASASPTNQANEEKVAFILDQLLTPEQKTQLPADYLEALRSYLSGLRNEEIEQLLAYDAAIRAKAREDALTQHFSSELSNQESRDPRVAYEPDVRQSVPPPPPQDASAAFASHSPTAIGSDSGASVAVDSARPLLATYSPLFNSTWVDVNGPSTPVPQMHVPGGSHNMGTPPFTPISPLPATSSYGAFFPAGQNDRSWADMYSSAPTPFAAAPAPPQTESPTAQVPALLQPLELQPLVPLQLGPVALQLSPNLLFGSGYSRTSSFPTQTPPPVRNAALLSPLTGVVDGVLRAATTGVVAPAVANAGVLLNNANQISARVQEGSEQASQFIEGFTAYRHSNPDDPLAKLVNVLEEAATSLSAKGGLEAEAVGMQHQTDGTLVEGQEAESRHEKGPRQKNGRSASSSALVLLETGGEGEDPGSSGSQKGAMQGVEYKLTNKADPFDFSHFASAAGVNEAKQKQAKEEQMLRNAKKSQEPAEVISNVIGTGFDVAVDVLSRHQQQERQRQQMQNSEAWALPYAQNAGSVQQNPHNGAGEKLYGYTAGPQQYGYHAGYSAGENPFGYTAEKQRNRFAPAGPQSYGPAYSLSPTHVALTQSGVPARNAGPEYANGVFLQYPSPSGPLTTSSGNYAYPLMSAYAPHPTSGMSAW
ncbi:conserved hypothetical protein [Neospora caninum Liverpool]|uniref:Uncharacterized protein n=1 Tax=Neospora caninum (strain Liverpool) TaxID=572307 RepID=F0VKY9_NEOCL|nr:conserved hypothetical protein [Neospora caninum Liverpool]CBZ54741.1 conserved hypothetical protein [Neospora caninum Liverpool]|eukprot:XP_003884769.1 conserved hypothetical protein [Neospora caninum Liverpool]